MSPHQQQHRVTTVRWLNGRASDYESGGSRFDPWVDRLIFCPPNHPLAIVISTSSFYLSQPYKRDSNQPSSS